MNQAKPLTDQEMEQINPGIRHTVKTLREWGFNTCDSGDGSAHDYQCDLGRPYVHISVEPLLLIHETDRLFHLLELMGFNFCAPNPQYYLEAYLASPSIEASYLPTQGNAATIHLINVVIPNKSEQ